MLLLTLNYLYLSDILSRVKKQINIYNDLFSFGKKIFLVNVILWYRPYQTWICPQGWVH